MLLKVLKQDDVEIWMAFVSRASEPLDDARLTRLNFSAANDFQKGSSCNH
jgi:hypothetical protein